MATIHPTAVVEDGAILADGVEVGPMCYVGPEVKLGEGTRLIGQCHISGYTTIGRENVIYPFASLGCNAQDISTPPTKASLIIGDKNVFREGSTVHTGAHDECVTRVGNSNFIMNCAHIAHDCTIGNNVILVGYAGITGHCEINDHVICSAYSGIHQFCRIGRFAMISAGSVFSQDIAPFVIAEGRNGPVRGINVVGLKRNGFSSETIKTLRNLYKIFFTSGLNSSNAIAKIKEELPMIPEVQEFLDFFATSKRGVHQGRTPGRRA